MIRLHRRDHAKLLEAADSPRPQMLGVLDAEAAIARPILLRDLREDVEQLRVGLIADGVDRHDSPDRGIRRADHRRMRTGRR